MEDMDGWTREGNHNRCGMEWLAGEGKRDMHTKAPRKYTYVGRETEYMNGNGTAKEHQVEGERKRQ